MASVTTTTHEVGIGRIVRAAVEIHIGFQTSDNAAGRGMIGEKTLLGSGRRLFESQLSQKQVDARQSTRWHVSRAIKSERGRCFD